MTVTEVSQEQKHGMTQLMYFAFNYPQGWIEQVWGKDSNLTRHFEEKWLSQHRRRNSSIEAFMHFMSELSEDNKAMMYYYILNVWKS